MTNVDGCLQLTYRYTFPFFDHIQLSHLSCNWKLLTITYKYIYT